MPLLPLITFVVLALIWLAVLLTVVSEGFGPGMHLWIQIFVLLGFPLLAYRSYLRIRAARGELD
ncbi:MAG: hypothetical protein ABR599_09825 [Gemmatimonadota bacterium]